jgi:RNA polymerase-binding transcription factor DksA
MDAGDSEDLRVLDHAEAELEDVERALTRLDDGSYGTCEVCGEAIGDDRLARSPVTRRCPAHAPAPAAPVRAGT